MISDDDDDDFPDSWPRWYNSVPYHVADHMHTFLFKGGRGAEVKSHGNVVSMNDYLEKKGWERY